MKNSLELTVIHHEAVCAGFVFVVQVYTRDVQIHSVTFVHGRDSPATRHVTVTARVKIE